MVKIKIDDHEFEVDSVSAEAQAQLGSIRYCDVELNQLQAETATIRTARIAYISALKRILNIDTEAQKQNQAPQGDNMDTAIDGTKTQKKKSKGLKGLFSL